jgi:di/tricarboxylate transporter
MFILSAGIVRTGALDQLTASLVRWSGGKVNRLLLLVAIVVPVASGFMNNSPLVVLLIPIMLTISKRLDVAPSKLLLPVAYLASLGGTVTLLGTSANIMVDAIYRDLGGPGLRFFEFTPMGLIYSAIGAAYILIAGPWLLPNRAPLTNLGGGQSDSTYISEVRIGLESAFVGRPVRQIFARIAATSPADSPAQRTAHRRLARPQHTQEVAAPDNGGAQLLELVRSGASYRAEEAAPLLVQADDLLLVAGTPNEIADLLRSARASLATVIEDSERTPARAIPQQVIEAIVQPTSALKNRLIGELELNRLYGVAIMGVQHFGRQRREGLRTRRLTAGDVLLLQGTPEGLRAACEANDLMIIEGVEQSIARSGKRVPALFIMLGVVAFASLTNIPIVTLALSGAVLMLLTGCLRPNEAMRSLDAGSLLLLAGTIPLGTAMEQTGLAQTLVDGLVGAIGVSQPFIFVALFFFVTWILTELLSNNAVAVLLTPIALTLARTTGINPTALIMVVIFGASASFTLPQGYQTNAMVMGPGGYRFVDYLRFGLPLSIICCISASLLIPLFWPLTP